jgi:hypothetical protein
MIRQMITALDAPSHLLDPQEQVFVEHIRKSGWTGTNVFADEEGPGFSYTTGFWLNTDQPEIIIFGLKSELAHDVCWDMFRDAQANNALPTGKPTKNVFGNLPAYVFHVSTDRYQDYLGWSMWFYGGNNPFPCLQIVWPDKAGIFPWEMGFEPSFKGLQTDLTENGWQASILQ